MQLTKKPTPADALPWKHYYWWSTLPNWKDERRTRIRKECFDPGINPQTYLPYSKNALNYRDSYVFVNIEYFSNKAASPAG